MARLLVEKGNIYQIPHVPWRRGLGTMQPHRRKGCPSALSSFCTACRGPLFPAGSVKPPKSNTALAPRLRYVPSPTFLGICRPAPPRTHKTQQNTATRKNKCGGSLWRVGAVRNMYVLSRVEPEQVEQGIGIIAKKTE